MNEISKVSMDNGKAQQFLAAIIVNLLSISSGISIGWPSPVIPQLRSSDPPVGDTPMSNEQISWIVGLLSIGCLLSIPFCGILVERIGRRNFVFLTGPLHIVSWLLVVFARNYLYVYAARLIIGMATAMTTFIVPMYVSEIASEDIRGIICGSFCLSVNSGVLFACIAGAFLSYRMFASLCLIFPIIFVFTIFFMPESPVHYARRNRQIEAHKSLMFFRNNNRSLVDQEMRRLQQQVNDSNNTSKSFSLREFFSDRATRKGLIISIGLLAGQQFSGIFAMLSYSQTIFQRAGTSISSDIAPIIIATIQIIGAYMSTMLMDRAGRRPLALVSCFGMVVSHAFVALFFHLQRNHYDVSSICWLPLVALSTYIVAYVLGMGAVPLIVMSEVFRLNISSYAITLCSILYWAMNLASVKIFELSLDLLGADGCFLMLACCCAAAFVFNYRMLLETKGRKREDIVDELAGVGKACCEKNEECVDGVKGLPC